MNEPIAHHPYGPSKVANYDPRSGGCAVFLPNPESNEKAESGTLKHVVFSSGEYELLGGDTWATGEVAGAIEFVNKTKQEFPLVYQELTLKTEKIFGTLDYLGMNEEQTRGCLVDLKFGAWSVTPARNNLQGWAYLILAFRNFPTLKRIKVIFYAARKGTHTEHTFWRYRLPALEKRVYGIIDRAMAAQAAPAKKDYTPSAINCSFCVRLNCPARLALLGTLVTEWTGKPVELPHLDLLSITTPQLASLKKLSNVFKTFSAAVDNETKRRAFDEGDIVEGYEIAEKSGVRTIVSAENITGASKVIAETWNSLAFGSQEWGNYILNNTELSVADLEKAIGKAAPYGKAALAKKIIIGALENAGLINANKVFFLQAIKE
jgi:Protein of unknown function (DUF2800)